MVETLLVIGFWNAVGAAVVALVAAGVACVCRRPAIVHALWLLVLLKLLTPPLWEVPVAWPVQDAPTQKPGVWLESAPAPVVETPQVALLPILRVESEPPAEAPLVQAATAPAPAPQAPRGEWPLREMLLASWVAGAAICWGLTIVRVIRFRRFLRGLTPARMDLQERSNCLAARFGLGCGPVVYLVAAPISPLVWALGGRARLLLPCALWEGLSTQQQNLVLAHELAHLRRGDHWVRLLELAAVGLYWWHPVAWWARRRLQDSAELCCDAWVVSAFPDAAPDYAGALVESAAFLSRQRSPVPAGASGLGPVSLLQRRVTMVLSVKTPKQLSWTALALLLAAATVLLPLWPTQAEPPAAEFAAPAEQAVAQPPLEPQPPQPAPAALPGVPMVKPAQAVPLRPAVPQPPTPAGSKSLRQLKDEIELLKAKRQIEAAHVGLAQAELKAARDQGQDVRLMEGKLAVQLAQLNYVEVELQQATRRLQETSGKMPVPPAPVPPAPKLDNLYGADPGATNPDPRPVVRPGAIQPKPTPQPNEARIKELERKIDTLLKELEALRRQLKDRTMPKDGGELVPDLGIPMKAPQLWQRKNDDLLQAASRELKVPFSVNETEQDKISRLVLLVSQDQGESWEEVASSTPPSGTFAYTAPTDGVYWFAVDVILKNGKRFPETNERRMPQLKAKVWAAAK